MRVRMCVCSLRSLVGESMLTEFTIHTRDESESQREGDRVCSRTGAPTRSGPSEGPELLWILRAWIMCVLGSPAFELVKNSFGFTRTLSIF